MTAAQQLKVASIGPTLEFDKVSLTLGRTVILDAVSFEVEPGSIHALVGPNGGVRVLPGTQQEAFCFKCHGLYS